MANIELSRVSRRDNNAITIYTSQFKRLGLVFSDGDEYAFQPVGLPFAIPMHVSRAGRTLYSGKLPDFMFEALVATVGAPGLGGNEKISEGKLSKVLKSVI